MVEPHRIRFESHGAPIVGTLFVPQGGGRRPAVVVDGPLTSVKEQARPVAGASHFHGAIGALVAAGADTVAAVAGDGTLRVISLVKARSCCATTPTSRSSTSPPPATASSGRSTSAAG